MFLIQLEEQTHQWMFTVEGFSGTNYQVVIGSEGDLKCTCPDFYLRKRLCKHLFFIIGRIAQLPDLTKLLVQQKAVSLDDQQYSQLIIGLRERLKQRGSTTEKKNDDSTKIGGEDESCFICFESLAGETMVKCRTTCQNFFHQSCMNIWLKRKQNCPLCRSPWPRNESTEDELTYLSKVKLKPVIRLTRKAAKA
jgi:hypothetical protein